MLLLPMLLTAGAVAFIFSKDTSPESVRNEQPNEDPISERGGRDHHTVSNGGNQEDPPANLDQKAISDEPEDPPKNGGDCSGGGGGGEPHPASANAD